MKAWLHGSVNGVDYKLSVCKKAFVTGILTKCLSIKRKRVIRLSFPFELYIKRHCFPTAIQTIVIQKAIEGIYEFVPLKHI